MLNQLRAIRSLLEWLDENQGLIEAEAVRRGLSDPQEVLDALLADLTPGGRVGLVTLDGVLEAGPLRIEPKSRRVYLKDEHVHLSRKQFDLLCYLVKNAGRVISQEELAAEVWGDAWYKNNKTIPIHISTLRVAMRDKSFIATVRGSGYRFDGFE
jgi:DNA-binding response OmpR family regulator